MEDQGRTEPTQSLADLILNQSKAVSQSDNFSIETAPDRFFLLHPSTCRVGEHIICDHEVVCDNPRQLMRLLDHPRASLTYSEAAWLFTRIRERAQALNDRFIVVSNEYVWDREAASLAPIPPGAKTTNNRKTKERLNEHRRSKEGVGETYGGQAVTKGDCNRGGEE